jgi:hypothetical protein
MPVEIEVLGLLAHGFDNAAIAARLGRAQTPCANGSPVLWASRGCELPQRQSRCSRWDMGLMTGIEPKHYSARWRTSGIGDENEGYPIRLLGSAAATLVFAKIGASQWDLVGIAA